MWVPYADDRYYRLRPSLAIKASGGNGEAIRVNDRYAMHPAMQPLEAAFKEGRLGVVQSVGVDNTSGSHFECQDQMEHGDSMFGQPAGGGWLGRFQRLRATAKQSPLSSVAIGTVLPYLRPLTSGTPTGDPVTGTSLTIVYRPVWPASAPELRIAESLTLPKFGLPAILNQASAQ
eukprot:gene16369-19998_t